MTRKRILVMVSVIVIVSIIASAVVKLQSKQSSPQLSSIKQSSSQQVSGTLYFQANASDWGTGNFAMTSQSPNGTTQKEDMWHHPDYFISEPFLSGINLSQITVTLYHEIVSNNLGEQNISVEISLIDSVGNVQLFWSGNVECPVNSRVSSVTTDFTPQVELFSNERLQVEITVTTVWAYDWYWGSQEYPSNLSYSGVGVPEFSSILILPLFMITTLLAVIIYRKRNAYWDSEST
jgi:hypothetical protein